MQDLSTQANNMLSDISNTGFNSFFLHVNLVPGHDDSAVFLPLIHWILDTAQPENLVLIHTDETSRETLRSTTQARNNPLYIKEWTSYEHSPELRRPVYFCGMHGLLSPAAFLNWVNTLTDDALIIIEGITLPGASETWQLLKHLFPSFTYDYGKGLGLLTRTSCILSKTLLFKNENSLTDEERKNKISFTNKCYFFSDYWKNKLIENKLTEIENYNKEIKIKNKILINENEEIIKKLSIHKESIKKEENRPEILSAHRINEKTKINPLSRVVRKLLLPLCSPALKSSYQAETPELEQTETRASRHTAATHHPCSHILFIAGEPDSPGVWYRCIRNAAATTMAGYQGRWKPCAEVNPDDLKWADAIVLWRVEFSDHVKTIIQVAHEYNVKIIFDTDDITFMPSLARTDIIDGIRTIGVSEERLEVFFHDNWRTMVNADLCFAPTHFLSQLMRAHRPLGYTVPNTYDTAALTLSRLAARKKRAFAETDIIRIGYPAGTPTHQRDFLRIVPTLTALMKTIPHLRLVLFRHKDTLSPTVIINEFPELSQVASQIEWRDLVDFSDLPAELARFDIAIAPLEAENIYCNAKSELKFFEAALAGVPSVVSPTHPYRECIEHGKTGMLAETPEEWHDALSQLIENAELRATLARNAYHSCLWHFGPQKQAKLLKSIFHSLENEEAATQEAEIQLARGTCPARNLPDIPPCTALYEKDALITSDITVIITSYNYEDFLLEALESVRSQTIENLDLIVVDDGSSDSSVTLTREWMKRHSERFNRLILLKTSYNVGLGGARNCGVSWAESHYFLPLDADNRLLPEACTTLLAAMTPVTAYAYPIQQQFGSPAVHALLGEADYTPMRLKSGNYIDAMALIGKWAWAACGGYYVQRDAMGWEDYDLWCSMAEMGLQGTHVKQILAEYRVHSGSMTTGVTEKAEHKKKVVALLEKRHPWISLVQKETRTTR